VVVQGTQKMTMMNYHNFKDEALITGQHVAQKTNKTSGKLKDENTQSNLCKLFFIITRGCVFFRSFRVHKKMSTKSSIYKL
jgi:hypothetical protein